MEIEYQDIEIFEMYHYNDTCVKIVEIYENYTDNKKTNESRYKMVRFKKPNGKFSENIYLDARVDESKQFGTEYSSLYIKMLTTIHYKNGSKKTIEIDEIYADTKKPMLKYKEVIFRYPDGSNDKDRSYFNSLIDKSEKFDTKYSSLDLQMLTTIHYKNGSKKTIEIDEICADTKKPRLEYKEVIFRSYFNSLIDKSEKFDTKYSSLDVQIAHREVETITSIHYNDGCTKKIKIYENYTGNMKTPVFSYKIVIFILPDGTIDNNRSYDCRLIIDKSEKFDTEYKKLEVELSTTIYYNDGYTKTLEIHKCPNKYTYSIIFCSPGVPFHFNDKWCIDRYKDDEGGEFEVEQVNYLEPCLKLPVV